MSETLRDPDPLPDSSPPSEDPEQAPLPAAAHEDAALIESVSAESEAAALPAALPATVPFDPAVSAMDRLQSVVDDPDAGSGLSWRWLAGLVLVVLGIAAVWMWTHRETGPDNDLLREAVAAYREFRPAEITNDPEEAASWVFDNLEGWLIFPPEIEGYDLLGVGSVELADAVFVPAFRYDGLNSATFVVFAYDYILLDEAAESGRLRLAPEVYARLAEPEPVDIRREGDAYVVTWRRRSIVFTAVAPGEELAERISQAVRRREL